MNPPPCDDTNVDVHTGRHENELVVLSNCSYDTLMDGVNVSKLKGQSLQQCISTYHDYCRLHHASTKCEQCPRMIKAAQIVLEKGICTLSSVFHAAFPNVTYTSYYAKQRLLKLPLAAVCVLEPSSGRSAIYVMELIVGVDYV